MAKKKKKTKKTAKKKPAANSKKTGARGRPFKKGQSGNPLGRPKIPKEVIDAARAHSLEAIETLAKLLKSRNPMAKIKAANSLLDRAWGKPAQALKLGGDEDNPAPVRIKHGLGDDTIRQIKARILGVPEKSL